MLKHRHLLRSILTMLYSPPPQSLFHVWKMSLQAIVPNLLSKLLLIFPYQLSWNHRMAWVGRNLKDHLVSTPLRWTRTPFTRSGCSGPPSNLTLNTARDEASTIFLGTLFQCLTTLTVTNFFLKSNLNLLPLSWKAFPLFCHYMLL